MTGIPYTASATTYGLDAGTHIGKAISDHVKNKSFDRIPVQLKSLTEYLQKVRIMAAHTNTVKVDDDLTDVIQDYLDAVNQNCRALIQACQRNDYGTVYNIAQDL